MLISNNTMTNECGIDVTNLLIPSTIKISSFFDTGIIKVNVNMTYNLFQKTFLFRLLCLRLYGSIAYYTLNILCWQIIPPTVYKICVYYLYDVIMSNYIIPTLLMMMIFGAAQSFRPKSICKSIFLNISSKIPIFLHYLAVTQA